MAKGDAGGGVPNYGGGSPASPAGGPPQRTDGASKNMGDMLALLSHMGIGARQQAGQGMGMDQMNQIGKGAQFGMNRMQQGWGMGQGNPHRQFAGQPNNPMLNPQGMMRGPAGQAGFNNPMPGMRFDAGKFPIGNMPMPRMDAGKGGIDPGFRMDGGKGIWEGPSKEDMDKFRLQGTTRSGSNIMRDGRAVGHYGNNNEAIFDQDQDSPFKDFPNFPGPIYTLNGQGPNQFQNMQSLMPSKKPLGAGGWGAF